MPKRLRDGQKTELALMASQPEVSAPFGPPKPSSIRELAKRGRRYRGKKSLQEAFAAALNDLFDAYLYTLTHPCEVSPYEVLALINAHREAMAVQKGAHREALRADILAQEEAMWLEAQRKRLGLHKSQSAE
jgi:hypothetical protein